MSPDQDRTVIDAMPAADKRVLVESQRSGTRAAVLSTIFPGLGQAYLRHRRAALLFALPVITLIAVLVVVFAPRGASFKIFDPTVVFAGIVVLILLGLWWVVGILNAWRGGRRTGTASVAAVLVLVLAVGAVDAFGAMSLWRIRNADVNIYTSDPLDPANNPHLNVTPVPTFQSLAPNVTPSPTPTRPPDYVDPSEEDPTNEPQPSIEPGPTPAVDITQLDATNDGLLNVLIAGLDWMPGRTSARTDTMIVVSANTETGNVFMFSFPRDTAQFPLYNGGTYTGKLNTFAGHSKLDPVKFPDPGMPALAYEVGFLLGMPIDYYASVNMPGFMAVVDAVGGSVTVNNEHDIADDQLQFYLSAGEHTLNSADALRYARSRHGQGGGDFARARRQQQLLTALRTEVLKPENLVNLPGIVEAVSGVLNTNFPPDQIDTLVALANQVDASPTQQYVFQFPEWALHLPAGQTNGRSVQFLRLDKIAQLSIDLFGEKSLYYGHPLPGPPIPQ